MTKKQIKEVRKLAFQKERERRQCSDKSNTIDKFIENNENLYKPSFPKFINRPFTTDTISYTISADNMSISLNSPMRIGSWTSTTRLDSIEPNGEAIKNDEI